MAFIKNFAHNFRVQQCGDGIAQEFVLNWLLKLTLVPPLYGAVFLFTFFVGVFGSVEI
jgi:hypothetical protein